MSSQQVLDRARELVGQTVVITLDRGAFGRESVAWLRNLGVCRTQGCLTGVEGRLLQVDGAWVSAVTVAQIEPSA